MPITIQSHVDRPLTEAETELVTWLLEHGSDRAKEALTQVPSLKVVAQCKCGCASIDFSTDGRVPSRQSGMDVVSDYWWKTEQGNRCGAYVFLREGLVAGLDLWSIDGLEIPIKLPEIQALRSYEVHNDS